MTRKIQLLGKRGRLVGTVQERENQSSGTIEKKIGSGSESFPFPGLAQRTPPPPFKMCAPTISSLFCNSAAWLIFPLLHCTYWSPSLPQKWNFLCHVVLLFAGAGHKEICILLGATGSGEVCLKSIPRVAPLNLGELKVKRDTHWTKPTKLRGGELGLEKHTTPHPKKRDLYSFTKVVQDLCN